MLIFVTMYRYEAKCYAYNTSSATTVLCSQVPSGRIDFNSSSSAAKSVVDEWNFTCDQGEFFWIFRYKDLGKTFYVLGKVPAW